MASLAGNQKNMAMYMYVYIYTYAYCIYCNIYRFLEGYYQCKEYVIRWGYSSVILREIWGLKPSERG